MSCTKKGYSSYRLAQEAIHSVKVKKWGNGKVIKRLAPSGDKIPKRSYKCEECGQWHLTSQEFRKKSK